MKEYKLKSQVCLSPNMCYPVDTSIPVWMLLILLGSSVLLVREIVNSINQ